MRVVTGRALDLAVDELHIGPSVDQVRRNSEARVLGSGRIGHGDRVVVAEIGPLPVRDRIPIHLAVTISAVRPGRCIGDPSRPGRIDQVVLGASGYSVDHGRTDRAVMTTEADPGDGEGWLFRYGIHRRALVGREYLAQIDKPVPQRGDDVGIREVGSVAKNTHLIRISVVGTQVMSRSDNGLSVGESGCTGEETEQGESAETCNPPSWNRPQQWHQTRQ